MVSGSLKMGREELIKRLKRLGQDLADDQEYKDWRQKLPKDWPI
jgi:hypothetical protein